MQRLPREAGNLEDLIVVVFTVSYLKNVSIGDEVLHDYAERPQTKGRSGAEVMLARTVEVCPISNLDCTMDVHSSLSDVFHVR